MLGSKPRFADISRLYTRKLIAERGIDTLDRWMKNKKDIGDSDHLILKSIDKLFRNAIRGEVVNSKGHLTPATIDAGAALKDFLELTQTRRPFSEFIGDLRALNETTLSLLNGKAPSHSKIRVLREFLETLSRNVGDQIQSLKKGQMISVA